MIKNNPNPRTKEQNRKLYFLFGQLNIKDSDTIAEIVHNATGGRSRHTSQLQFIECMELIKKLEYQCQWKNMRKTVSERIEENGDDSEEYAKLDRKRKGVIKAIFRYMELRCRKVSIEYVKGVACRAAGVERFNQISEASLTRIYAEFCKKQKVLESMNPEDFIDNLN